MIFGVTHNHEGEPIQRPIVNRKLGVGLPPGANGKNYPTRLEHFIVSVRSPRREDKGGFIKDVEFTKRLGEIYGNPLMEVDVVLLSNDPEHVLSSEYAWRSQNRSNALQCHGDGRDATRRWEALTEPERKHYGGTHDLKDWIELESGVCGNGCPHLMAKRCKPSADLYFMFPEDPVTGSVSTLHTGSWEATRRLSSSLYEIFDMVTRHGGGLRGLRLKLVARPYRATFKGKDGVEESSTQLAFNLEFRSNDYKQLMPRLIEESRRLETSIPEADDVVGLTDEEIAVEFHPVEEPADSEKSTAVETAKPASALDRLVADSRPAGPAWDKAFTGIAPQQQAATIAAPAAMIDLDIL